MVQFLPQWPEGGGDIREIHHPGGFRLHRPFNADPDVKGVAMQSGAFVTFRHVGEPVGGFEIEFLENDHDLTPAA